MGASTLARMANNPVRDHAVQQQQEALLDAVKDYVWEHGYSPSLQELAAATGVSERTVRRHVTDLVEKGQLERHGPRTIRPV